MVIFKNSDTFGFTLSFRALRFSCSHFLPFRWLGRGRTPRDGFRVPLSNFLYRLPILARRRNRWRPFWELTSRIASISVAIGRPTQCPIEIAGPHNNCLTHRSHVPFFSCKSQRRVESTSPHSTRHHALPQCDQLAAPSVKSLGLC